MVAYTKKYVSNVNLGDRVCICGVITLIKDNYLVLDDNINTILVKYNEIIKYLKIGDLIVVFGEIIEEDGELILKPHITPQIEEKRELLWKFEAYNNDN